MHTRATRGSKYAWARCRQPHTCARMFQHILKHVIIKIASMEYPRYFYVSVAMLRELYSNILRREDCVTKGRYTPLSCEFEYPRKKNRLLQTRRPFLMISLSLVSTSSESSKCDRLLSASFANETRRKRSENFSYLHACMYPTSDAVCSRLLSIREASHILLRINMKQGFQCDSVNETVLGFHIR